MHSGLKVETWFGFDLMCLAGSDVFVTSAYVPLLSFRDLLQFLQM